MHNYRPYQRKQEARGSLILTRLLEGMETASRKTNNFPRQLNDSDPPLNGSNRRRGRSHAGLLIVQDVNNSGGCVLHPRSLWESVGPFILPVRASAGVCTRRETQTTLRKTGCPWGAAVCSRQHSPALSSTLQNSPALSSTLQHSFYANTGIENTLNPLFCFVFLINL